MLYVLLLALAFLPMLGEANLAARHDRALRHAGAREPRDDVFRWMQVAYPTAFLIMAFESWIRRSRADAAFVAGLIIFAAAKGIKYWAIATLGPRWTFRVLVPPASARITTGPYQFMRHPNYLGVMGELVGMALMAQAPLAGSVSVVLFGALIAARIRVEERALGLRQ
jgi:methyltransferase